MGTMKVKLSDIFVKRDDRSLYSIQELVNLDIKADFVERLSQHFQIPYRPNRTKEHNLCYANSPRIRFEYKTTFSEADIINHLYHTLNQKKYHIDMEEITF